MRKIIIVGGSRGIGNSLLTTLVENNKVINISRVQPTLSHTNLTHHTCDVLIDELPDITEADSIIYCPGSINLKPISRLKLDDFRNDFEINVIGAVKTIQKYLSILKKGDSPSRI
jgi:short-subunit dehydrogenase